MTKIVRRRRAHSVRVERVFEACTTAEAPHRCDTATRHRLPSARPDRSAEDWSLRKTRLEKSPTRCGTVRYNSTAPRATRALMTRAVTISIFSTSPRQGCCTVIPSESARRKRRSQGAGRVLRLGTPCSTKKRSDDWYAIQIPIWLGPSTRRASSGLCSCTRWPSTFNGVYLR